MSAIPLLLPEIAIVAVAVSVYLGGAFLPSVRRAWGWMAVAALAFAASALWRQHGGVAAGGAICLDELAQCGRWMALGLGLLLAMSARLVEGSEYVGSLLSAVAGWMLVFSAGDLVLLFVSLELISIPTYVLLNLGRRDAARRESAAKYFFLSVLASATLLYGFSFLYGAAGSTELAGIRDALAARTASTGSLAALARPAVALIFAGLCFKIAAVPFHFYAPDVYEGTTHPNAALLSVAPKAAGLVALVRILAAVPGIASTAWPLVLAVSILTMTLGNVMALRQKNLRRLLAYSSIAQAGYMLLAMAVGLASPGDGAAWSGFDALGFYFVTYALATVGVFAAAEFLGLDAVGELAGLGRSRPLTAAMVAACLLSLTGIPPLAGFWGKLLVFAGALNTDAAGGARGWFVAAAIVGALNATVGAAYYLRIAAVMYFQKADSGQSPGMAEAGAKSSCWWTVAACAALVVALGIYPGPLMQKIAQCDFAASGRTDAAAGRPAVVKARLGAVSGGFCRALHAPSYTPSTKSAATPACPTVWSSGNKESSRPTYDLIQPPAPSMFPVQPPFIISQKVVPALCHVNAN